MSESRTIAHEDNSYGDCVSCSVYVGDVDGEPDYRPQAFPCPTVILAGLRAKAKRIPGYRMNGVDWVDRDAVLALLDQ